jgi:colicin import membrane protein
MSGIPRAPFAPVGWSIALHALLAALLFFGLNLPDREPDAVILPIDAVVVDDALLQAVGQRRRDDERAAAMREAEEARRRREQEEQLQQVEQEKRAEEEARLVAEQKAKSEAAAEAKQKAAADAKLKAEADAKLKAAKAAEAKAAAERKRTAQETRERDAREAELRSRLADEETRTGAGYQSLKASWVRAIQLHVEQRWYEPPGLAQGLSCTIIVTQIPGGEVVGTRFGACNGNAAVRQSIETAVRNASPLPPPPEAALFEREVELVFTPREARSR